MEESSTRSLKLPRGPIIVAMKGHSCSGKTTLAREIVRSLRLCHYVSSLLRYDDIRASIRKTLGSSSNDHGLCDDVAYRILWRIASSHLSVYDRKIPRAIVLDLSLSNRGHLEQILGFRKLLDAVEFEPFFLVVECQPRDEVIWREWSESRLASSVSPAVDEPLRWEEIQREISEHKEYLMDGALCLTVDTTDSTKSVHDHATDVIRRMSSNFQNHVKPDPNLMIEGTRSGRQASWRHFSHDHSLIYYPQHIVGPNDEEATSICTLCREAPSGPVYSCSQCGFYLHESCAKLPHMITFGGQKFVLGPTSGEETFKSGECLVCYGQSGVLYTFEIPADSGHNYPWQIHPRCARLPHKLKHSCHEHHLELRIVYLVFTCGACGTYGNVAGYYCEDCTVYFHVMCTIYLEARVLHKRHWHPLVLCTIPRDETNEYYCEICATDRHPDLWVYYCKPCEYEAHISCVNPRIKQCNPDVLLPENRAEGKICDLLNLYESFPGLHNPILDENSGSRVMWEPVGDEA